MTNLPSLKVTGHRRLNAAINVGDGEADSEGEAVGKQDHS
jgi:hypothetical protein